MARPKGTSLPDDEKKKDRVVKMDAAMWAWCRQQVGGAAAYLRRLIIADKNCEGK